MSGGSFDAPARQRQLDELQKLIDDPGFWSDQKRSSETLQQRARLEETINLDRQIASRPKIFRPSSISPAKAKMSAASLHPP